MSVNRSLQTRALDGTFCGKNKICHFAECIDDNTIRSNKYKYLLKNLEIVKEVCPQGTNNNFNLINCKDLINNPTKLINCDSNIGYFLDNKTNNFIPLENKYSYICCQECKKAEFKKLTCENLNKNPCYNGGKCVTNKTAVLNMNAHQILFYCKCPDGFEGDLCLDFKPCYFDPCEENEICYEYGTLGHFHCLNKFDDNLSDKMNYSYNFKFNDVYLTIFTEKKLKYIVRYYLNIFVILLFFLSLIICTLKYFKKIFLI